MMMPQVYKKVSVLRIIAFVFIMTLISTTFFINVSASSDLADSYKLRPQAARVTPVALRNLEGEILGSGDRDGTAYLRLFRIGHQPGREVPADIGTETTTLTTAVLVAESWRGLALGLDATAKKAQIRGIKDGADAVAKAIYEIVAREEKVILLVRVSEGFGRDEVAASLKANDLIVPPELEAEMDLIRAAIEEGQRVYTSRAGVAYQIKDAIIDVIEVTNMFVTDVDGMPLAQLSASEAGATSIIATGPGVASLGNCPDVYTDTIFTTVPIERRQEFIDNPLDPELIAQDPQAIVGVLQRIAEANGITLNELEIVVMKRTREEAKLEVLRALQRQYPGLEVVIIKDGTVAHSLLATFGRREGKHKVVITVGGAPEGFLNLAVASIFRNEGTIASIRVYSMSVNKTTTGADAQDFARRYDFSEAEKADIRRLRPEDSEQIIAGNKLFTQEDVIGEVEGNFTFITNNGIFGVRGAEFLEDGSCRVVVLRVGMVDGRPCRWFEERIIPKEQIERLLRHPRINFANTQAVEEALEGIVEAREAKVLRIINEKRLRESLIDMLVYDATFNPDPSVAELCRRLIRDIAALQGSGLGSVYELYREKAQDTRRYTIPAINIRGMAYNTARALFESALANNVGMFILEIAKSEIGYTAQRPAEYTTAILAAAIKAGYKHPIFLQGDHFQISLKDYQADPAKAREAIQKLIREAVEAGFYQIDLDMSTLVDWSKETYDQQQRLNYTETALLTAYVRSLERELGLDRLGIVINLGGEIGEIGKGIQGRNSSVEDLQAFWQGYTAELGRLSQEVGYAILPITKIAIQTGTKHGGIRDAEGQVVRAKVSFNAIAEVGAAARSLGLAGVVQHGASTLDPRCFVVFAGNPAPEGFEIPAELLSPEDMALLAQNPTAEVHLATAYQDTILDHALFPEVLRAAIRALILERYPVKEGQSADGAFVENRKNAWGPFKVQLWNLPGYIQEEMRASLMRQFDTVFRNLGVVDSLHLITELNWGRKLAPIAEAIPEINSYQPPEALMSRHREIGGVYPILIHHQALLRQSPDGIMFLLNIMEQLGEGGIKFILHISRDDVAPAELDKVVEETLQQINEINGGRRRITRENFAAVVTGTQPQEVARQVEAKVGAGIYQVIGPDQYCQSFQGVIRIILDQPFAEHQMTLMAKALRLGLELIPNDGKLSQEELERLDALFSVDEQGNFHVKSGEVAPSVESAAEEYQREAEVRIRI